MKKLASSALKRVVKKVAAVSLNDVEAKVDHLIKQNQILIDKNDLLLSKNNLLIKKADRIIGHKTVYIKDGLSLVRLIDGARVYINPEDQDIGSYVALHGFWEPHIEDIWRKLVKEGDVIFDVGANFGYFSAVAARKIKTGHIHLFEANDKFLPYLTRTMSSNGFANKSTIAVKAVADKKGVQEFRESQNFWGRSTMTSMSMGEEGKIKKVDVITLDQYYLDNKVPKVDLMKMDIEGYEEKAYAGMKKIVAENKHMKIALEFSANHYDDAKKFYKQLKSDFKHIYIFDISGKLVDCRAYDDIEKGKVGSNTMILLSNEEVK